MKRILILTASFGEGHNAAARGLRDAFARLGPETAEVEMHDLFAETFGIVNDWTRRLYLSFINHRPDQWSGFYRWLDRKQNFEGNFWWLFHVRNRLSTVLARFRPDAVLSVFPTYSYLLNEVLGPAQGGPCRRFVVVTDSITVNGIWYRVIPDFFLVPNELTAVVLRSAGVPPEKIRDFGFPVDPRLAAGSASRPGAEDRPRQILYVINAAKAEAPELTRRLAALPQTQLTVTVGRDENLRRVIEGVRAASSSSFEIIGWSDEVPSLLHRSHLLISKAGGATVQETIAAGCPMIINQVVPGQEEGNARLIEQTGAGRVVKSNDEAIAAVDEAFASDAALWREWAANIRAESRPGAALDIAKFVLSF